MNVEEEYKKFCEERGIPFSRVTTVTPYDETTLFCPAGMQAFKQKFSDKSIVSTTVANIQPCIRMNDFDETGDGTHLLYFNMIGFFSFRDFTIHQAISFWYEFIEDRLDLVVDYATVHPDKYEEWALTHHIVNATPVVKDVSCKWTDGEIGGYCTEFFINDVEIGNIVNPLGDCIDVGFGLERLQALVDGKEAVESRADALIAAAAIIIESGYKSGPKRQGYVLRKLLREIVKLGGSLDHPEFTAEVERSKRAKDRYDKLKDKNADKSKEWWYDTHGVVLEEVV